jgi:hypothetical protein
MIFSVAGGVAGAPGRQSKGQERAPDYSGTPGRRVGVPTQGHLPSSGPPAKGRPVEVPRDRRQIGCH